LAFIPLNNRGNTLCKGFPQKLFLSTVAALLGVLQRYKQLIAEKQISLAPFCYFETYSEFKFGNIRALGIEQITRFLAATGVTTNEAELWCPWVTTYIEMELLHTPTAPMRQS
jgi:hypothetical protein